MKERAIEPDTGSATPTLAELNYEAGTHAIPTDRRELDAALRAGRISWERCPYYALRYGERGERFTRSDSAWIVTLADADPALVRARIQWLGSVLASRGMPRWLLEQHLEVLHDELARAVPERRRAYGKLRDAALGLRAERRALLSDDDLASMTRADGGALASLPDAVTLLASAVCDEAAGIPRAVTSLEGWMTDRTRFTTRWIDAVKATIQEARRRVRRATK